MKMRRFVCPPTLAGRQDFRLLYETFRGRDPEKCAKDERPYLAVVQRALERISDPMGELPAEAEFDLRLRRLHADGGTIDVSQKVFTKMQDWIDEGKFQAGLSVQVEDLRDRLEQAEKYDDDDPKGGTV